MRRELAIEFSRVTEAAALAGYKWLGRGDKNTADGAAVHAMRIMLNLVNIDGTIVIGEGEIDEAPMLYIGEKVGTGNGDAVDIAVDPIEGTRMTAMGQANALAVLAVGDKGCFLNAPDMYMEKLAVGPGAKGSIDLNLPLEQNLRNVATALGNFTTGAADQLDGRIDGTAGRQQIVHYQHLVTGYDGIGVQLQGVGAVLEGIGLLDHVARQLARLADRHEAQPHGEGNRCTENEATGFGTNNLGDPLITIMIGQQIDGGLEGFGVLDQAGDVTKQNARLRIVGNGLDACFDKFQGFRIHVLTAYFFDPGVAIFSQFPSAGNKKACHAKMTGRLHSIIAAIA